MVNVNQLIHSSTSLVNPLKLARYVGGRAPGIVSPKSCGSDAALESGRWRAGAAGAHEPKAGERSPGRAPAARCAAGRSAGASAETRGAPRGGSGWGVGDLVIALAWR